MNASDAAAGAAPSTNDRSSDRRNWVALYVLCAGVLMIVLDATVVNVALPSIKSDLGFSQSDLAWVVNAYLIAFGGLLLLSGRLGDLLGQRRMFMIGLAVFTLASLACALASTQAMLIGARFVQGAGGAMASAVILGMIVTMFPQPAEQARAMGVYSFVASAGGSIGLLAGGVLTDLINWHWIFFINVPIGLATGLLAMRLVENRPGIGWEQGADLLGAVLVVTGVMIGAYALVGVTEHGWLAAQTLVLGALSVALLAIFVWRQSRIEHPLMPLRLFKSRNVTGANLVVGLMVVGMFGMFFLGALYLQGILGYDPLEVGLAFLPATIVMGILSLGFAQMLNMRFGSQRVLIPSLALIFVGLLLFARTPVDGDYWTDIFPAMLVIGLGIGASFPSLMMLAMSGASEQDSGVASGLVNTTAQVGGALGLALLATVAAERTNTLLGEGTAEAAALNGGYHLAYLIGAACVAVAFVVAIVVLEPFDMKAMAHGHADSDRESMTGNLPAASEPAFAESD